MKDSTQTIQIRHGDSFEILKGFDEGSIGAVVCDPPYGLSFMGKEWDDLDDNHKMQSWHEGWLRECYRVLKPGGVIKAFSGCYDAQTEVLTKRGWVPFPDATENDLFASRTPTGWVEWLPPIELVRQPHLGPMIQYQTNRIDLLVTPNHKVLVTDATPVGSPYKLVRADTHSNSVRMTKTSCGQLGLAELPTFCLPAASKSIGPGGIRELPTMIIPWGNWLPFFGLWIAEGSTTKSKNPTGVSYRIKLSHTDMGNLNNIKELLLPWFNVRVYPKLNCACINSKQLYEYLAPLGKAWEKFIPSEIKNLSPQHLRLFIEWYLRGDGDDRWCGYTTSPHLRDDFQEMALYAGWAMDWVQDKPKKKLPMIKGRTIYPRRPSYRLKFLRKQMNPLIVPSLKYPVRKEISVEEWGGQDVFCVELPRNHTLYVRRNGKAVWCGNTRTFHRLAAAMENVGFVLDPKESMEAWIYSSGFPKSLNIGKAIDKMQGAEREVIGEVAGMGKQNPEWNGTAKGRKENSFKSQYDATAPATEDAKRFDGYGTALKPAFEPFIVGKKPK